MRLIDADDAMERIEQAYKDMGVDTHGIWNKQLAEIFKAEETDVEDIRMCLHKILGAVAQAPTVDRPQGEWKDTGKDPDRSHPLTAIWYRCSECGYGTNTKTNYCPDCGAEMKGDRR